MRRTLFTAAAGVSALLFVAADVMSVRSYRVVDRAWVGGNAGSTELVSMAGGLSISRYGPNPSGGAPVIVSSTTLLVYPLVAVLALPLPVLWAVRRGWQRPRPPGRCPSCGYDLRATPHRCPECGAVPARDAGSG